MSLIWGYTAPLGYSGSTPEPRHCPVCHGCWHRTRGGHAICSEPEEHRFCWDHYTEAMMEKADQDQGEEDE